MGTLRCRLRPSLRALAACALVACLLALLALVAGPRLAPPPRATRDVAAVVVKNEADILRHWLAWHSAIFGAANVVAVDQESSDPDALRALAEHAQRGGAVLWRAQGYARKGEHTMAALALAQQRDPHTPVRLFFPLDVDEFLVAAEEEEGSSGESSSGGAPKLLVSAAQVRCAIERALPAASPRLVYHTQYCSSMVTSENGTLGTATHFMHGPMGVAWMKKFFLAASLRSLDHGNHWGSVAGDWWAAGGLQPAPAPALRLLHYHARDPRATLAKALDDVHGFGYHREARECEQSSSAWWWWWWWWWPFAQQRQALCFTGPPVPEGALDAHLAALPQGLPGLHKVSTLLNYRRKGLGALVQQRSEAHFALPPLPELLLTFTSEAAQQGGCRETARG